jgi:hypothetical protein
LRGYIDGGPIALASATNDEESADPATRRLLDLDTPWRKARCIFSGREEDVALFDFAIDCEGESVEIVGLPWEGGTRQHLLNQLNWVLAWLASEAPGATFTGHMEEWDGEGGCYSPAWFEVEGSEVREYPTQVVKLEAAAG